MYVIILIFSKDQSLYTRFFVCVCVWASLYKIVLENVEHVLKMLTPDPVHSKPASQISPHASRQKEKKQRKKEQEK